jgi:hypothetical protein
MEYRELTKRELTPEHVRRIRALLGQIPTGPRTLVSKKWLTTLLESGTLVLGAFHNGRLVGVAMLCLAVLQTGNRAWIQDIVEDVDCRRNGILAGLLELAEEKSRGVKAESIHLTASIDDFELRRVCERLEYYRVVTIAFKKKLFS